LNPFVMEISFVAILGLMIGSFLNVCIYRIPNELSIIKPRSRCPSCEKTISWFDNIPVLSFILLRGRCRYCKSRISIVYPLTEILFALIFIHVYVNFRETNLNFVYLTYYGCLCGCLFTASIIDLIHYIIPDEINLFGIIIGLIGSTAFPSLVGEQTIINGLLHSVLGISVGFGVLRLVVFIGGIVFKKEAMGLGDPKFLAMIGAFLGYKLVLLVIFLSSFLGAVIGGLFILVFRKNKKDTVVPYGPFLALGAYISLFWGDEIIRWYFGLLGL